MADQGIPSIPFQQQQPSTGVTRPSTLPSQFTDYLMLDSFGTVLEVRRMSPREARDTNLELQALNAPYHWEALSSMTD
jgi:hypothetical protein